ncbi:NAD(P)/FAD-dependent oxidoreductase [Selenomonas timonae]|uniref:NAD(P)/FAD-dependent oxidoreductase n=1 Tax=Selenomonas timonae TaxID=2754044 RepID=A0A7G7VIE5_9FIRM|nr:NAD(P)/FAD-dependent oxidoreductase [Selenomonas timonae]QNH53888.1 NAD(P)/FAD-dependent oxidoreductase [Selenomonas timonae]
MKRIIVVGAGPAGMMAAAAAAECGGSVLLLEKMPRVGRKMMITGKGRCNVTSADEIPDIIKNIVGNGRFLNSSLRAFDNVDVMAFFERLGVPLKTERGNRVFPVSDRALDVVDAIVRHLHDQKVEIRTNAAVTELIIEDGRVCGVRLADGTQIEAAAVILATGGASYPATGSTGDGYALARAAGHTVTEIFPALVPLVTSDAWVKDVQGLSLRNVRATLYHAGRKEQDFFGEMLFTHFGVTGPIILQLSRRASELLAAGQEELELRLNLKPALTHEKLRERVERDFATYERKQLRNAMIDLLPKRLIDPVLNAADLSPERSAQQVSAKERERLVHTLQALALRVTGTRPIAEAIVTAGGVATREIDPRTMESKLVKHLYFVGELVDVDAHTGGYNLQAAFSMGHAAGSYSVWNLEGDK